MPRRKSDDDEATTYGTDPAERKTAEAMFTPEPNVSRATRAAMPGQMDDDPEPEQCSVTINGTTYAWTAETEDSVPEEARAVWARHKAANA